MSPDKQEPGMVTRRGYKFGIDNRAFKRYMTLRNPGRASTLLNLSIEMIEDTTPLVMYASASALSEAGLLINRYPDSDDTLPYQGRIDAIDMASLLWKKAGLALREARSRTTDPVIGADLLKFELRSQQAQAYVPSMKLVAALVTHEATSAAKKEEALQQTIKQITEFGEEVIDLPVHDEFAIRIRSGMCNKILSGLLLSPRATILPASFRQEEEQGNYRADLLAVTPDSANPMTHIEVSLGDPEKGYYPGRFTIFAERDLVLKPRQRPRDALRTVLAYERGVTSSQERKKIRSLSQSLGDSLARYTARR